MARCSGVWPNEPSAFITSASVFHSFVFSSSLKSWSTVVGLVPSNRTRTLSFFFIVEESVAASLREARASPTGRRLQIRNAVSFRPLEFAGEKIIHHQCRDESGDTKILLRIVIQHMQPKFIAASGKSDEELVHGEFLFVRPLGNRVQQSSPTTPQIDACLNASGCGEELS